MSQQDIYDWLKERKKKEPDRWWRVKEIQEGLAEMGKGNGTLKNVPQHLFSLMRWGDIEWRGVGIWQHHKEFRAK